MLEVGKGGPKLKESAKPDEAPALINVVYPQSIKLPARNVTMGDFASMLQRAVLDRPVVDKTGLTGSYNYTLQFGREWSANDPDTWPSIFTAVQEQLGLRLESVHENVPNLVVDHITKPTEN